MLQGFEKFKLGFNAQTGGTTITTLSEALGRPVYYVIQGKSYQSGRPMPTIPAAVNGVGDLFGTTFLFKLKLTHNENEKAQTFELDRSLHGIGSYRDSIIVSSVHSVYNTTVLKRINEIQFKDCSWNFDATYSVFYASLSGVMSDVNNSLCDYYTPYTSADYRFMQNLTFTLNNGIIYVKDENYTGVGDFLAAVGNAKLYVPYLTPQIEVMHLDLMTAFSGDNKFELVTALSPSYFQVSYRSRLSIEHKIPFIAVFNADTAIDAKAAAAEGIIVSSIIDSAAPMAKVKLTALDPLDINGLFELATWGHAVAGVGDLYEIQALFNAIMSSRGEQVVTTDLVEFQGEFLAQTYARANNALDVFKDQIVANFNAKTYAPRVKILNLDAFPSIYALIYSMLTVRATIEYQIEPIDIEFDLNATSNIVGISLVASPILVVGPFKSMTQMNVASVLVRATKFKSAFNSSTTSTGLGVLVDAKEWYRVPTSQTFDEAGTLNQLFYRF